MMNLFVVVLVGFYGLFSRSGKLPSKFHVDDITFNKRTSTEIKYRRISISPLKATMIETETAEERRSEEQDKITQQTCSHLDGVIGYDNLIDGGLRCF
jgi:hypothetical protein